MSLFRANNKRIARISEARWVLAQPRRFADTDRDLLCGMPSLPEIPDVTPRVGKAGGKRTREF